MTYQNLKKERKNGVKARITALLLALTLVFAMVTIAFADAESTPHLTVHAEIRASQVEAPVYLDADGRAVTVQVCV